jgi:glycosyltransferase involved in cell wall biosynthesis
VHGRYLEEVLKSIDSQSYDRYEVIAVNDSGDINISKIITNYGVYEIIESGSLLKARYLASMKSKGSQVFFLDETRPFITVDALEIISKNNSDMIFVNEKEVSTNLISKASSIERQSIFSIENIRSLKPYVLPRVYNRQLVMKSLDLVRNKLGPVYEWARIMPEDLFIYYEARKLSNNFSIETRQLMKHYGDFTLRDVVKKYYRYGRGFGISSFTSYRNIVNLSVHERLIGRLNASKNFKDTSLLILFIGLKGFSGILGEKSEKMRIRYKLRSGEELF